MIESLRKWGTSWSAKILLGLLAMSMGIFWGMGDLFMGRHPLDVVATVGDAEILTRDLRRELELRLALLQQRLGKRLTAEQISASRLPISILMEMIQRTLLDQEADRLKLVVTSDMVQKEVGKNPQFHTDAKVFSREKFQQFLRANGLYETEFLNTLKKELRRSQLIKALTGTLQVPKVMADLLASAQFQDRFGAMREVKGAEMTLSRPTLDTLKAFYDHEKEQFRTAEQRIFSFVCVDPQDVGSPIEISETELRQGFEKRQGEFAGKDFETVKETIKKQLQTQKAMLQVSEMIQHIDDLLASGATLEEIAPKYHLKIQTTSPVSRGEEGPENMPQNTSVLPADPALRQELLNRAFSLEVGAEPVLERLSSGLNYIVQVRKVFPSQIPPFEVVQEKVRINWTKINQDKAAFTKAKDMLREAQGSQSLGALKPLPPVSLSRGVDADKGVPPEVKTILFEMAPGESRVARGVSGSTYIVKLLKVVDPTSEQLKERMPALLDQINEMLKEDLLEAYIQSLRARYHVKVNRDAVRAVVG